VEAPVHHSLLLVAEYWVGRCTGLADLLPAASVDNDDLRLPTNLADNVRAGGLVGRLTVRTGTVPAGVVSVLKKSSTKNDQDSDLTYYFLSGGEIKIYVRDRQIRLAF
jgi:hypothetical protein